MYGYSYKNIIVRLVPEILKEAHITQMDLSIMKIKLCIVPLSQGIRHIEDPCLRFEGNPQTRTDKTIIQIVARDSILRPAIIQERKQK